MTARKMMLLRAIRRAMDGRFGRSIAAGEEYKSGAQRIDERQQNAEGDKE